MPVAEVPGARLHVERHGNPDGPRLLSISGSGSDLRQGGLHQARRLTERFDVTAYDHRGLGRSVDLDADRPLTMADFAADAVALLDHLGWERCHVLGVSFGGMVAQELAVTHPERIDRLVLACTSPGGAGGSSAPLHELVDLDPEERLRRRVALLDVRTLEDPERRAALTELFAALGDAEPTAGARRQLEARRGHDVWDRLPALDLPVLIAAGRHDGIAPAANQEALLTRIPGAELQWFDGGHAFFLDDPTAIGAIADWLLDDA